MTPEIRNQKAKEFALSVTSRESFSRILVLLESKGLDAQLFKEGTDCFLQEAYLQGAVDELLSQLDKSIPDFVSDKKRIIEQASKFPKAIKF